MNITQRFHRNKMVQRLCVALIVSVFLCLTTGYTNSGNGPARSDGSLQTVSGADLDGYIQVRLPDNLSPADLKNPSAQIRSQIDAAVRQQLERPGQLYGDVIVLIDANGQAILPDAQKARELRVSEGGATLQAPAENELNFTFDSPSEPWTSEELASVTGWTDVCYGEIRTLYGPPAFSNVVNVVKSTAISAVGTYSTYSNVITLKHIAGQVLCHEMVHAFHDDYLLSQSSWEEGFARAVEVEACKRAGLANTNAHDYYYDVAYEELNRPVVGAKNGRLWAGWSQSLLRYQLAGYAWAKAMIEDDTFFIHFNSALYAAAVADLSILSDEEGLKVFAADAKPTIEAVDFETWYPAQHVLNTDPPTGNFIYIRASNNTSVVVYLLNRQASGTESDLGGLQIDWTAADCEGNVFASGSGTTTDYGWVPIDTPEFRRYYYDYGYEGRVEVMASAVVDGERLEDISYIKSSPGNGVFGVVVGEDTGTIELTPLESGLLPVSVPVSNGAFQADALLPVRGPIQYVFTSTGGDSTDPVVFTKDATPYFLHIDYESSGGCDSPGPCS